MGILQFTDGKSDEVSINRLNRLLSNEPPRHIARWIASNAAKPVLTTNFRPLSIALLHMVSTVIRDIPVLWIDTGYNTDATYRFAHDVSRELGLNLHVYRPSLATARRGDTDIPPTGSAEHARFTRIVKLEPFERALGEWRPDFWITGIRHDQTAFRKGLDVASTGPRGIIRIAPFYHWTEVDVEAYIYTNGLPDYDDYFDPTKGADDRECGIQTLGLTHA